MMHNLTCFTIVLAGVLGVAACNPVSADAQNLHVPAVSIQADSLTPMVAGTAAQSAYSIEIHKMKFQSKILAVKIGDTVTWVNRDVVPHTVTALDKSWNSGELKKGESFTLTITAQMQFDYFCLYHRQMKAKLVLSTHR